MVKSYFLACRDASSADRNRSVPPTPRTSRAAVTTAGRGPGLRETSIRLSARSVLPPRGRSLDDRAQHVHHRPQREGTADPDPSAQTGRNFAEILPVIDSLRRIDAHKVAMPVDCQDGDNVIIVPSLSNEDAKARFPNGWKALKPHLRMVAQPPLPR